jgi:hypothetical protein
VDGAAQYFADDMESIETSPDAKLVARRWLEEGQPCRDRVHVCRNVHRTTPHAQGRSGERRAAHSAGARLEDDDRRLLWASCRVGVEVLVCRRRPSGRTDVNPPLGRDGPRGGHLRSARRCARTPTGTSGTFFTIALRPPPSAVLWRAVRRGVRRASRFGPGPIEARRSPAGTRRRSPVRTRRRTPRRRHAAFSHWQPESRRGARRRAGAIGAGVRDRR